MVITAKRIFVPWYLVDGLFKYSSLYEEYVKAKGTIRDFVMDVSGHLPYGLPELNNVFLLYAFQLIVHKTSKVNEKQSHPLLSKIQEEDVDDRNILKSPNIFLDQALKFVDTNELSLQDVHNESNHMVIAVSHFVSSK